METVEDCAAVAVEVADGGVWREEVVDAGVRVDAFVVAAFWVDMAPPIVPCRCSLYVQDGKMSILPLQMRWINCAVQMVIAVPYYASPQ